LWSISPYNMKITSLFYVSFVLLVGLQITGCQNSSDTQSPKNYFDVKGFIGTQIKELSKRKPLVIKQMVVGESTGQKQTTDIDWAKELALFSQADLNKQAYQLSYTITKSGKNTLIYSLKSSENLPVKSLKIVLNAETQQPEQMAILLHEENMLYDSEKKLSLTCTMRPEGVWLIKTYTVEGFQHLSMADKKIFSVKANIH